MSDDVETANETDSLLERGQREVKRFWEGFIDFAFQGNILQIAFGLMYAPSDQPGSLLVTTFLVNSLSRIDIDI